MWRSAVQVCLGLPRFSPVGGLAQLARAPALQAGGQRFESVILHVVRWERRSVCGVNPNPETTVEGVLTEIFDILTHKTVSKDFKLKRLRREDRTL